MSTEVVNGDNGVESPSVQMPTLEDEITAEIEAIRSATWPDEQRPEVAIKFLCEARSLARAGKAQLAERKRKAARCVLSGGGEDE